MHQQFLSLSLALSHSKQVHDTRTDQRRERKKDTMDSIETFRILEPVVCLCFVVNENEISYSSFNSVVTLLSNLFTVNYYHLCILMLIIRNI